MRRSGTEKPCPWPSVTIYPGTLKGVTQALRDAQMLAKNAGISQVIFALYGGERVLVKRFGADGEVMLEGEQS
jgi:hypothetical protein